MHRRVRQSLTAGAVALSAALTVAGVGALEVVAGGPAGAVGPGSTIPLVVDQGTAFSYLGHSCGGIQEQNYATGFDPTTGYPTGATYVSTRCGGSGRGGGYHTTTYSAWIVETWDFTGVLVTTSGGPAPVVDPTFTATDANGNQLVNANGSATLTLGPSFTPAPRLTAVSVTSGPAAGGTALTLTGTGFTGATGVSFGGAAAAFTVVGDTSITVTSPSAPAGTVDIVVTGPGGSSTTGPVDQFTFVAAPVVTSISPTSGPMQGGTTVTLTGANLTDVTSVAFGGQPALFTVVDDATITATSPPTDSSPGDSAGVTASSIGGTSTVTPADQFTYTAGSGGGGGSASCAKLSGTVASFRLSKCTPAVPGEAKAVGSGLGSSGTLTWSSDGATTDLAVAVSSPGQGSCGAGATEEDVSGTVVGGTSLRTAAGDTAAWSVCVSAKGKVSLVPGTSAAL
jgi:hypothetical protein